MGAIKQHTTAETPATSEMARMTTTVRSNYTGYLLDPPVGVVLVIDGEDYPADSSLVQAHPQYFVPDQPEANAPVD